MVPILGRLNERVCSIPTDTLLNTSTALSVDATPGSKGPVQTVKETQGSDHWDVLGKLISHSAEIETNLKHIALVCVLCGAAMVVVEPALAGESKDRANLVADIAENSDFWANVLRYVSYFFSVLLGTVYVALKPVAQLLQRPRTAVLVIAAAVLLYLFVSTTVSAMLGLNDLVEYEPSSIVTPSSR
jgi:ABC-type dipeptide/oligopeptide/nickel transport system permease component